MNLKKYSKYSLGLFSLIVLALAVYVLLPFLTSIAAAAIIAYVFYPGFKKLNKYIKNKMICSLIMIVIVLLIVIIPLFFIANALFIEATNFYQNIKGVDLTPASQYISNLVGENIDVAPYVKEFISPLVSFIVKSISDLFLSLPARILILFITIFIMYYFFKDGDRFIELVSKLFPIRSNHKIELLTEFDRVINATIYGVLVSAVIQGLVGTIGLIVFDVSSPIMWGVVMILAAMVPFVGTWLVWFPVGVFKVLQGELFDGIGLLIYGALIVSTIDNIIKPKLISKRAQIHPVLIILGIFGGIKAFGIIGIMIGPLLLGVLSILYNFYARRIK